MNASVIVYFVYFLAFYSLCVLCIVCLKKFPEFYKDVKERMYRNKYVSLYLTDVFFKTQVTLYSSLIFNLVYVIINILAAIIYETNWFGLFAVYYAIMAIMRFLLVLYVRKNQIGTSRLGELKCSRFCAFVLLTVNLVLSGVILMMVYFERGFEYQGFLIYLMALYTFYITTTAIIDLIKYRKYNSPIMSVSKMIKLAAALFSMLFLETAMFAQFGGDTPAETKRIMIMSTGAGISLIVVTMSVYMIIYSTKEIKEIV